MFYGEIGFPFWPAIIDSIDNKTRIPKYNVTFYGTGEVALIREINIKLLKTKPYMGNYNKNPVLLQQQ